MLGDFPLGAIPLGAFPPVSTPVPQGGAARFPAPILQHRPHYAMGRYTKRSWFEDEFLADWKKRGLAGLKDEEEMPLTISQILGRDKL
jgi:hypothetical protein